MNDWRDPGLQPERTVLAWRRTTLSLAVGAALLVRVAVDDLGLWAALVGAIGVALSLVLWVVSTRRFARAGRIVHGGSGVTHLGGISVAATFGVTMGIALIAVAWVLRQL